jgi:hypothetical protein
MVPPGRRTRTGSFNQLKWTKTKFEPSAGANQRKQNQSYDGEAILVDATWNKNA